METFGELFLTTLWIFLLIMFLMVLFYVISDLFRDSNLSGLAKAIWIIFLIVLPPITCLVYLIARGGGMRERAITAAQEMQQQEADYIKSVVSTDSPADQIAKAKELHDRGVISDAEFESLKAKALSS